MPLTFADRSAVARATVFASLLALPAATAGAQAATTDTTLRPRSLGAVVVSATRTEQAIRTLPSHVLVVSRPEIAASAASTVPDLLRRIPGFNTRDLQSGIVSGPSQSIVSFRGLGGSSAGRALILLDGLPAGDPFSGWLDWGRIPMPMLESAEIVRGGGSMIWGSRSLAGVVNIRTIAPRENEARLVVEGGSLDTRRVAGTGSFRSGSFSGTVGAERWVTGGFITLRQHGPADEAERNENRAVSTKLAWDANESLRFWLAGSSFAAGMRPIGIEERQFFDEGRGGMRWLTSRGAFTASTFRNQRSAVQQSWTYNTDRTTRTVARITDAPAHSNGVSLQWTQMAFGGHELTAGSDFSSAGGQVTEVQAYVNNEPTRRRNVTGTQDIAGFFLQDAARLTDAFRVVGTVRMDRVSNSDGRRVLQNLTNNSVISDSAIGADTDDRLTGSLGLRWQQREWVGWRVSVYEGFRAPSMYEMYHPRFSTRGGTVTEANAQLEPEVLRGAEVGADMTLASSVVARITAFTNRVTNPIMDVTIGMAGDAAEVIAPCGLMPARQTCGQRQNLPGLRSRGIETELTWQPNVTWDVTTGYAFTPTKVSAPNHPADGMQAIRSPRHMINAGLTYSPRWITIGLDGKYVGTRFDDDQNTLELPEVYLVGLRVNREITRGFTGYLKVENLLNEDFDITRSRNGTSERGAPRWITAGIRASW